MTGFFCAKNDHLCYNELKSKETGGYCVFQIAICDDRLEDLSRTLAETKKWLDKNISIDGRIDTFHNAKELHRVVQEKPWEYDLYILDIVMHGTNGIEFGRWLQRTSDDALMIYVSTSRDYAMDAFDNHAVRYLLKPIKESEFESAMDTVYSLYESRPRHMITINTQNHITSIAMEDIMYIENNLKNVTYTLKDGHKISCGRRQGAFEDAVGDIAKSEQFMQPHKSYFINMKFISALQGDSVLMDDGKVIPVARRRINDTQNRYIRYISEE